MILAREPIVGQNSHSRLVASICAANSAIAAQRSTMTLLTQPHTPGYDSKSVFLADPFSLGGEKVVFTEVYCR